MAEAEASHRRSFFVEGMKFSLINTRYHLFFTQGVTCANCGREGSFFLLESPRQEEKPHLNLYCAERDEQDRERLILFTKDHIVPRSWGGGDEPENFQVMCAPCNGAKGNRFAGTQEAPFTLA